MPGKLQDRIRREAASLGFDLCRFTHAQLPSTIGERLEQAVGDRHHAGMQWLADTLARRKSPQAMWPGARSAIMLAMNYGPETDPLQSLARRENATISVYARNRDYHDIIKGKLKMLASRLASLTGCEVKVFVDTAPLMEKPLAEQAGLGWQGKHTNLVSRDLGSWFFLGAIFTTLVLEPDPPGAEHCGRCRACLDACPTDAFPAPFQIDARRCISYLTIEHAGPVDPALRPLLGNRIYGCDDCLAACPWNKFAQRAQDIRYSARDDLIAPPLADLAALDDASFRARFSGSPIKRIGRDRFVRNVLYAIGNSAEPRLAAVAQTLAEDPDETVRDAARWAMSRLKP